MEPIHNVNQQLFVEKMAVKPTVSATNAAMSSSQTPSFQMGQMKQATSAKLASASRAAPT